MKNILIILFLLASQYAFCQTTVTPQFRAIPYEQRVAPLAAYQQEYSRVMGNLESLEDYIVQILSQSIDGTLRSEANSAFKSVQNAIERLEKSGDLNDARSSFRQIRSSVQQSVVRYNQRVSQQSHSSGYGSSSSGYSSSPYSSSSSSSSPARTVYSKEVTMRVGESIRAVLSEGQITRWELEGNASDYLYSNGNVLTSIKSGSVGVWGWIGNSPKRFTITIK